MAGKAGQGRAFGDHDGAQSSSTALYLLGVREQASVRRMARTTPTVREGYLEWQTDDGPERIAVGTAAWFAWLDQHTTFAYVTPVGSLTVRRDRGQRGGWYWRAYLRRDGRLQRCYLGASAGVTAARLQSAAETLLGARGAVRAEQAPSPPSPPSPRMQPAAPPHLPDLRAQPGECPFLAARLRPPPVGRNLLERPALLDRISAGVRGRLTLLVAPAAFGKTTLLAKWCQAARRQGAPVAWLTVERGDDEPARFWRALLAALQAAYPGFGQRAVRILEQRRGGPTDEAVIELLDELSAIPHDLTIVLDDYQHIDAAAIHTALAAFVSRLPPHIHLLVAGRSQPPWALGRLWATHELSVIRAAELCFTEDEAVLLLRERLQLALSPEQIVELVARTEGWVGGLQLAAQALREQPGALRAAALVAGDQERFVAFFAEEVLHGLPARTQTFLRESAILERLSGPLCAAVTGEPASEALLQLLAHEQLFVVPLDAEQGWYRYHPLFGAVLRERLARLTPERCDALYRSAVDWFARAGLLEEAISHGLAGGLVEVAAALLEQHGDTWLLHGELRTLRGWLDALPEPLVRGRPRLLLLQLCALMLDARWDCVEPLLREPAPHAAQDTAEWSIVEALAALVGGQSDRAAAALERGRTALRPDDRFLLALLAMLDGATAWVRGDQAKAQALLAGLSLPHLAAPGRHLALLGIAHQAHFDAVAGRLETALVRSRQVHHSAASGDVGVTAALGMALLGMAQLHYERNELAEARSATEQAYALAQQGGSQALIAPTMLVQAQILLARGELAAAAGVVEGLERQVRGAVTGATELVSLALARAELALARDEPAIAASWLGGVAGELQRLPPGSQRERAERLQVRVLLERGQAHAALNALQPLVAVARERARVASLVPLLALAACAHEALGQHRQATESMLQALEQGVSGPFVQSIIAAGPLLRPVLDDLPPCRREVEHYAGIVRGVLAQRQRLSETRGQELEPLSARERDVLRLLANGATNREIAAQLSITEATVKKYLSAIYLKLGVARRTQAILMAQAHNLV
jgi:LuxR family transcriptional regulator, maltose regulon positive regulatory protein